MSVLGVNSDNKLQFFFYDYAPDKQTCFTANFEGGIALFGDSGSDDCIASALQACMSVAIVLYGSASEEQLEMRGKLSAIVDSNGGFLHRFNGRFLAANLQQKTNSFVIAEAKILPLRGETATRFTTDKSVASLSAIVEMQQTHGMIPICMHDVHAWGWSVEWETFRRMKQLGVFPKRNPVIAIRHPQCISDLCVSGLESCAFPIDDRHKSDGLCPIVRMEWGEIPLNECLLEVLPGERMHLKLDQTWGKELWPECLVEMLIAVREFIMDNHTLSVFLSTNKDNFCRALVGSIMSFINCAGTPITFVFFGGVATVPCDPERPSNVDVDKLIQRVLFKQDVSNFANAASFLNVKSFKDVCLFVRKLAIAHHAYGSHELAVGWKRLMDSGSWLATDASPKRGRCDDVS